MESFSSASRKRDLGPRVAPRSARNGNFVLSRAGLAVASRPAPPRSPFALPGRLEAASPPAGLGAEDPLLPGDSGGPGSAASCRGDRRAGAPAGPQRPLRWVPPAGPRLSFFSVWWLGEKVINHREPPVSQGLPCQSPAWASLLLQAGPSSVAGSIHLRCFSSQEDPHLS